MENDKMYTETIGKEIAMIMPASPILTKLESSISTKSNEKIVTGAAQIIKC